MRRLRACVATAEMLLTALSSHALCSYKGKMYAKTTLAEEYRDSKWVVHVKVLAADQHWSDVDDSWTLYRVQVLTAYKGKPPLQLSVFTYRDSGGFYLDKGMYPDLGGDYLLFLTSTSSSVPAAARNATEVNYSCGQSKQWSALNPPEKARLETFSKSRKMDFSESLPTDENRIPRIR